MTIQECYSNMGANYEDVLRRLDKEERILRFLSHFLEEGSYMALHTAIESGNREGAFRAAHSLKGVCLNLGLTPLYCSADTMAEELRTGEITMHTEKMFNQVTQDYQRVVKNIQELLRT